jgi:hypothetical protein
MTYGQFEKVLEVAIFCFDSSAGVLIEQCRDKIMPVQERGLARA